ncbi:tRNA dihydrouridine(20/20a) synthase DusA [Bowmanella pacifica]|uniref:tRNA-dihydrouridine(20/20a) synthase n=1 Tax=Bowmanella pacifica TaxID=502051 RepID=A0A917Z7R1_9ALTE|nr:tRNA dihydrouridine(20/20a) synthase DusA [Bowmanella pacifica]GGO75180.1 tRNA-dihydrouridine(20/20a) synthase [Bowmanella pacifica]
MADISFNRRISIAPMLDWTDRHYRYFMRRITRHTLLYTEMVTTGAILFGKGDYLGFNCDEHPVALQLGGSNPADMAECARRAEEQGYDEININVGCPSDRVKNGRFGACLMAEPETVAACVSAMQDAVNVPVTVKCRIGIDDMDEYAHLDDFIRRVADAGCDTFIIHARKAWLQGLSPKENREIPPLMYDRVYLLKEHFPHLHLTINGGVKTLEEAKQHLSYQDGVMIGREAYANPYMFASVDSEFYGDQHGVPERESVIEAMVPYVNEQVAKGARVWHVARHMLGIFQGQPGGRIWRRYLSENGTKAVDGGLLLDALEARQAGMKGRE